MKQDLPEGGDVQSADAVDEDDLTEEQLKKRDEEDAEDAEQGDEENPHKQQRPPKR